jgi:multidrug efflux pump subunit AcrB
MNLVRTAVKNNAATLVIFVILVVLGAISAYTLPLQLVPDIEQPQITISTAWRNAAPAEMEAVIIEPIENAVKSTPGVTKVTSNIQRGSGQITLMFEVGYNMQKAMIDVLNNVNQAPPLPRDAIEPIVSADMGPNVASLMIKTLPGNETKDLGEYQRLIDDVVKPRLARIPGMAVVKLESARPEELRISFDPWKAAAMGLSVGDIGSVISSSSDASAGIAHIGRRQFTVRFEGQYSADNLQDMVVGHSGERPVYLRDIATVETTLVDRTEFYLRNGRPAYYLTVRRHSDANTVQLLDRLNVALKELNTGPLAQAGLAIDLSFDSSVHVRNAIELVQSNLGLGVLLALAILWSFLRCWRSTLIIALTIPVSLMVAFIALKLFNRSLNVISLAGLAFAVGLVLDAAIIVQENIVRLLNEGMEKTKAVVRGATQVAGALFASTTTSVAIFIPILFMAGVEGQLFSDLALTLSIAVIASFFSAITILPLANQRWLKKGTTREPFEGYWDRLTTVVMRLTSTTRSQVLWILGLLGGSALAIVLLMPKTDFMPRAPIDGFFMILNMPPGGNIDYIETEIADIVKARLDPYLKGEKEPKIKSYNLASYSAASTLGFIYADDPRRVEELMEVVKGEVMTDLPEIRVSLHRGSMISVAGGGNGRTVDIDITGPDLQRLMAAAQTGIELIEENLEGAGADPVPGLVMSEPYMVLTPNDYRITQAGLTRKQVADAVTAYTGGLFVSEYFDGHQRVNAVLRGPKWHSPEELAAFPIYSPSAGQQTLGELADITLTAGPSSLRRVDGRRTVSLVVTPPEGMPLESAIAVINQAVLPEMRTMLDGNFSVLISGNANQMAAAIAELGKNFLLAIFILLLLMTALFRSLKDSVIVLLVMPMAVAGGVLGLSLLNLFTFQSLDLLTMIGFIILLGLVVNNAILLVDQTRQAQRAGMRKDDAVAHAVRVRAKPVYMSSLTSLFGMLPLMVMPGVGSEIYRGLATVIVGGMAVSTLFTLVLFPCLLRFELPKAGRIPLREAPQVSRAERSLSIE